MFFRKHFASHILYQDCRDCRRKGLPEPQECRAAGGLQATPTTRMLNIFRWTVVVVVAVLAVVASAAAAVVGF